MIQRIRYEDKEYNLQFHPDLIGRIASEKDTFFEEWLLTPLKQKVKSFNFVVDIGANIGNHAFFFKEICQAKKVVCFEPHPDNFLLLQENCPTCEKHKVGLSSENINGFLDSVESINHNSGTSRLGSKGYPIEIKTLDSYNFENVTFIKIDVEGYELEVLKGAKNTIEKCRPDILVETHSGISVEDVQVLLPNEYNYEKVSFETHYLFTINE
jgi:FkbM family methyltransferase